MSKLFIDHDTMRAFWRGKNLGLTNGELRIITLLAGKPGTYFSYRQIYDVIQRPGFHAGDGERGVGSNVRSAIKRIRRKFEAVDTVDNVEDVIINFNGFGYGLHRDAVASTRCCPTCGQVVLVMPDAIMPAAIEHESETVPVADYERDAVLLGE